MTAKSQAQSRGRLRWLCLTFISFCLALGISWILLTPLNFGYQQLYSAINIDQHIATYAPKNIHKQDFQQTDEEERFRLFAEIVTSIHKQGEGLAELAYHTPKNQRIDSLLTHDEVLHLEDVAILIDRMRLLLLVLSVIFIGLLIWLYRSRQTMPSFRSILLTAIIVLLAIAAIIFLIGPHKVFYQLHVWVFPVEHKWFFFYEESLMSTMMKAPDLFAYIAILLVVLALPIFIVMMWLIQRVLVKHSRTASA